MVKTMWRRGEKTTDEGNTTKWNTGFLLLLCNFGSSFSVAHFVVVL